MHQPSNQTIASLFINRNNLRATEIRPGFISKQSFNFAGNQRPGRTGFGSIRVFNDDLGEDKTGIPMHPHENYEI